MGLNISEIVQGSTWKNFMKYLYGWGAALVLLGALFKLMYWPGAGVMLTIGMTTEVVIFFFSAFEPVHYEVDWTLVYPELAGMSDEEELRKYRKGSGLSGGLDSDDLKELISGIVGSMGSIVPAATGGTGTGGGAIPGGSLASLEKFNKMLENANLSPALFEKVSKGLQSLSETSARLADISEVTVATDSFSNSMRKASESMNAFSENYQNTGQVLNESVNILSDSFQKTAGTISESGQNFMGGVEQSVNQLKDSLSNAGETVSERIVSSGSEVANQISSAATNLTSTYMQMAVAMKANEDIISSGTGGYQDQLDRLNKNMSALNAAHELHLQGTSVKLKESEKVYSGVEGMMKKLKSSIEETEKYVDSVAKLNQNIAALNSIYGNMLSAMSVPK